MESQPLWIVSPKRATFRLAMSSCFPLWKKNAWGIKQRTGNRTLVVSPLMVTVEPLDRKDARHIIYI